MSATINIGTVSTAWAIVGTGDFDGDGRADILWRDSTGNTAVWLMSSGTVLSTASLAAHAKDSSSQDGPT